MMFLFVNIAQICVFLKKGDIGYENCQIYVLADTTLGIKPCL